LLYFHHRIIVFNLKYNNHDNNNDGWSKNIMMVTSSSLRRQCRRQNQDEEEEDEGLFDVYGNRSGTGAEGHTTKGILTLGGGFPNHHSTNCNINTVKSVHKLV
jgi:hypothetical protein